MPDRVKKQRFAFLAVLLTALFSFPLISIADKKKSLVGIPILFVYIFLVWAIGIFLLYRTAEKKEHKSKPGS